MKQLLFFAALLSIVAIGSCRSEEDATSKTKRPIVMIHGTLASGDTYEFPGQLFNNNRYNYDKLFAFDYNSTLLFSGGNNTAVVQALDRFIDSVLTVTKFDKVDLIGHSLGSSIGYDYLLDPTRAVKIEHFAYLGGIVRQSLPSSNVPFLNVYSTADSIVTTGSDIVGATNVRLTEEDHYQVATSAKSFEAIFSHFNLIGPSRNYLLDNLVAYFVGGRAVTLGENTPEPNATIEIWEISATSGERLRQAHSVTADANGKWGPLSLKPRTYHEFKITPQRAGARPVSYFRAPFKSDDNFFYLRTIPPPTSLAGFLLAGLPSDSTQAVVGVFTSAQSVIAGRDALYLNGSLSLSTHQLCNPGSCTIAMFLYDGNSDQVSSGTAQQLVPIAIPFIRAADASFPVGRTSTIRFNDNSLTFPHRRSDRDGITVLVF